jgi:hypothetical protein
VFEKRVMENLCSSVYRQCEIGLKRFEVVLSRDSASLPLLFTYLGKQQTEIVLSLSQTLFVG